jgi:iron complex outermembrane receptor protein
MPKRKSKSGELGAKCMALLLLCVLFSACCALAQAKPTSSDRSCSVGQGSPLTLHGTITDTQNAAIPNASVIIECGNFRKSTVTDGNGTYAVDIPPGTYSLRAEAAGFSVLVRSISVSAEENAKPVNLTLTIIPVTGDVTVIANPDYVADNSFSATKTNAPLIDTPASVSVVTTMQMEARDVQTVDQAISYTAGVDPEPYGNDPRIDWFFIRGFAENDDAVYLDGLSTTKIYAIESQFGVSPYSLQSVDVVKGPTSVLSGTNEPGGLINMVSKIPPSEATHELRFEGGTFNRFQGSADFGGPLGSSQKLFYRATGQIRQSDAQVQFAQDNFGYAAPSATWKPDGKTILTVRANYSGWRQGSIVQFLPAQGTRLPNPNGKISTSFQDSDPNFDKYNKTAYFGGYSLQRTLNDRWLFRQNFRWSHLAVAYKGLYGIGIQPDLRTLNRASVIGIVNAAHAALDNQIQGNVFTGRIQHTVLGGFDFYHQGDNTQVGFDGYSTPSPVPSIDLYNPVYFLTTITAPSFNANNAKETINQYGIYLQDQLHFGRWIADFAGAEHWVPATIHDYLGGDVVKKNDSKFTGKAAILYHSKIGLSPYFSYSTSFNPVAGINALGAPYKPDFGKSYEGGLKFQPNGANAFLTASLFSITQDNVLTADLVNPMLSIQTGQVRSRGFELEGVGSLLSNLNFVGSFTHNNVIFSRNNDGTVGKHPPYTPSNLASAWLDYTPRRFGVGAGARFIGITQADPFNVLNVPGHTVLDAEVHYNLGETRLAFSAANLLDRTYVAYCFNTTACNYGPLRTFTGEITYHFKSLTPWRPNY